VEEAFGTGVDYALLIKIYGKSKAKDDEIRYSPAECMGSEVRVVSGNPDGDHISTSYVERQNLTMWTNIKQFTRLTNAFSKKIENHMHAIMPALHVLRLLSYSPDAPCNTCHGSGRFRSRVVDRRVVVVFN